MKNYFYMAILSFSEVINVYEETPIFLFHSTLIEIK